jgi:hypothetical protein
VTPPHFFAEGTEGCCRLEILIMTIFCIRPAHISRVHRKNLDEAVVVSLRVAAARVRLKRLDPHRLERIVRPEAMRRA